LTNIPQEASDIEVRETFGHRSVARHVKFEGFHKDSRRHAGLGWIQFMDREIAKTFMENAEIRIRDRVVRI